MMRGVFVLIVAVLAGCAPETVDIESEQQALLDMHANVLRAHLEDDVEGWLGMESDEMLVVSRGEIIRPTPDERRAQRARYLSAADFTSYQDLQPPVASVSDDGTLGWVVAQVEARGTYVDESGQSVPIEFASAWIEMYRRSDGAWQMVGNVSNFKPETGTP